MTCSRGMHTKHTAWPYWWIATCRMGEENGIDGNSNGQGGIRTLEGVAPLPVFETGSFSHSDTCPRRVVRGVKVARDVSGAKHPVIPSGARDLLTRGSNSARQGPSLRSG
jgi:hypothetical protein